MICDTSSDTAMSSASEDDLDTNFCFPDFVFTGSDPKQITDPVWDSALVCGANAASTHASSRKFLPGEIVKPFFIVEEKWKSNSDAQTLTLSLTFFYAKWKSKFYLPLSGVFFFQKLGGEGVWLLCCCEVNFCRFFTFFTSSQTLFFWVSPLRVFLDFDFDFSLMVRNGLNK